MAHPYLAALHGVDIILPDGRILFTDLHESFGAETVGLIGHNGSGKSTLGRVLAGELEPAAGRIERLGRIHYVEQQAGATSARSLAEVAGLDAPLAALRRLAAGDARDEDFDIIGDRWDLEARWDAMVAGAGLDARLAPQALSGGQHTLLALIGAFCSDADLLVLDEPGNHLDAGNRAFLLDQMRAWRQAGRGLLLISHDRDLLDHVERTLEVHAGGLRRYGGGWSLVAEQRDAELAAAGAKLERARTERRQGEQKMRDQAERAARRSARGARAKADGGMPKIVLNALPQRAEQTDGARAERHARERQALRDDVANAFATFDALHQQPVFPQLDIAIPPGQTALAFDGLVARHGPRQPLDWRVQGPARIAIAGPNGCGKSTLLRTIAGEIAPTSGTVHGLPGVLLDQHLKILDPARSLLDHFPTSHDAGRLRQMLALAGLGPDRIRSLCGDLSGGERMRGALLLAVLRGPTPKLLMLDEPTNHLDLASVEALEAMLASWPGALVVVSHDGRFLEKLALTHRLEWAVGDWQAREA
ncbi:ATPase components of ABC transporters with duplicated ATPase domains [Massilia sp. PDC64]|nr:ATP-binding cassette domain-containing protein [Massilia sp. PDC64]SDC09107.1 ATPase components of ABC transporters with duplicated ATPase domains [Massilia sp. PDC64]